MAIYSMRDMMTESADSLAKQMARDARERFLEAMKNGVDYDALNLLMCNAAAKHFTTSEIEAMSAFYSSAAGRSTMKKMAAYMSDIMPSMMTEMQRAFAKATAQRK